MTGPPPPPASPAPPRSRAKAIDTLAIATLCFVLFFAVPFAFDCYPCLDRMDCADPSASASASAASASGSGNGLYRHGHLVYQRWRCEEHHYNPMATLLQSGQEGAIKQMFAREYDTPIPLAAVATLLLLYFPLSVIIIGTALPGGNFVPAMTFGGLLGRLMGELLWEADLISAHERGSYGLMGAAACLAGVTRIELTLAVILTEISGDIEMLPIIMFVLAIARGFGDILTPAFDHMMIHVL